MPPRRLTPVSLAGVVQGQAIPVDFSQLLGIRPVDATSLGTLRLQNESGCGLLVDVSTSGAGFPLVAGQWFDYVVGPLDTQLTLTVDYLLPNPPVSIFYATFFPPDEPVPPVGVLGNSPIGLSGSVSAVTNQVINDGNPAPTVVVEGTPLAGVQSLLLENDGSGLLAGGQVSLDNAGRLTAAALLATIFENVAGNLLLIEVLAGNNIILNVNMNAAGNYIQNGTAFQFILGSAGIRFRAGASGIAGNPVSLTTEFQVTAAGLATIAGALSSLGGQASVGSFGAPVIMAQALHVHVTATTPQTILTVLAPATGLYRASLAWVNVGNLGTGNILAYVGWTDPDLATTWVGYFGFVQNPGAGSSVQPFNIANTGMSTGNSAYSSYPIMFYAQTGQSITLNYQHPGGTVNDFVTGLIERLA